MAEKNKEEPKVLFITRKYPLMKGGMESYSYNLISNYRHFHKVIKLGKKQTNLIWFLPYCAVYLLFHAGKYDVIELGDMLLCGLGWIAKKANKKVKVAATVHGLDITYNNRLYQFYLKKFSHGFDMYIPNSRYTEQIARDRGYSRAVVIPLATLNETNAVFEKPDREKVLEKYEIPKETVIITTVGRLVKRKGVAWFGQNVLPQIKQDNLVYLVVGEGSEKAAIQEAVLRQNETRVRLFGKVPEEELRFLYANTDIFLMPNIMVEGYGMIAVEAAAAEYIVVAANLQGILDAVKDGTNGILYPNGYPETL